MGVDDLRGRVDFLFAFNVVHEMPSMATFFAEAAAVLKPGAKLFLSDPNGHQRAAEFAKSLRLAQATGFRLDSEPQIRRNRSALLARG
jgi:2-polyprenyl-3-methyl-5-hydroxy-6-metoxy-1,4-benzoquinol methylase